MIKKSKKIKKLTLYLDSSHESGAIVELLSKHPISFECVTNHNEETPKAEFETDMNKIPLFGDIKKYGQFVDNILDYWENL